ncbi:hypothetical protein J2W42_003040 [Rhizobium tibeticum]|uniref:VOC family protein n=1 Tax=Rhizobium tibeticum TaxID=501024 RepID=UPI002785E2E5|nr:hypothetical protein [Rhizobium tibeticum]MDP9810179.1 hypothetical protein [Rhizobium tibeticum]
MIRTGVVIVTYLPLFDLCDIRCRSRSVATFANRRSNRGIAVAAIIEDWNGGTPFSFISGIKEACEWKSKGFMPRSPQRAWMGRKDFYTLLSRREPDDRTMDGLIQWRNIAGANIQIFHNKETAGSGGLTIVVPKMDRARRSLEEMGVDLTDESQGDYDYGRIAQIADPDGNRITLAEPPFAALQHVDHLDAGGDLKVWPWIIRTEPHDTRDATRRSIAGLAIAL